MTMILNDWVGQAVASGRYVVTKKIGEGGMGSVYCAHDRNIDAEVVIKVPRQAMLEDPEFAGRFTREIRSLVRLSHPRIVKVTDVGESNGLPFAVMQFLPGGSLEERRVISKDGQTALPDPRDVANWLSGIAEALDYIHSQGYVHRDVKPGNILFDGQGHSFLSDFGVAKVLSTSIDAKSSQTAMTGAGMVLGTPEYMAPELIMGEPFDGRVDQYALAITVYEVLCGRRPFEDEAKTKVLVLHTTKPPPSPTEFRPEIPDSLATAILKGLAKAPGARYPSCVALAQAVALAAADGLVRRDNRVRVKCPMCARSLAMSPGDFEKLKQKERRITCPGCKQSVVLSAQETVDASTSDPESAVRGGTVLLSLQGQSGEYALAPEASGSRSGTVALGSQRGTTPIDSRPERDGSRSGTVALSAQTPSASPARRPTETPPAVSSSTERMTALPRDMQGSGASSEPALTRGREPESLPASNEASLWAKLSPQTWVAACASAAVALIAVAVFWKLTAPPEVSVPVSPQPSRGVVATEEASPNSAIGTAAVANAVTQSSIPRTPTGAGVAEVLGTRPARDPASPTKEPKSVRGPADRSVAAYAERGTRPPKTPQGDLRTGASDRNTLATPGEDDATATDSTARTARTSDEEKWSPELLQRKPLSLKLTLDDLLKSPHAHAGQVVVPTGMYFFKERPYARTDGSKHVTVSQRTFAHRGDQLELKAGTDLAIDIVPELANQFASLTADEWDHSPAILSIWVSKQGLCRLIKAELLTSWMHQAKAIGYSSVLDMVYTTVVLKPDGKNAVRAADQDWERVDRMLLVANVYKRRFKAIKNQKSAMERDALNSQMAAMFNQMVRSSAAAEASMQRARNSLIPTR